MASNNNDESRSGSPMHLNLTGQFSPEDIQELLGVMGDGGDQHHPHTCAPPCNSRMYSEASAGSSTTSVCNQPVGTPQPTEACATMRAPGSSQPGVGEEAKAQARSERKRSREKQRRSDVNKQFADLTQLLQKIDAEDVNEEDVKNGTTSNRVTFNPSNRVDLIARTIVLLERLHEANKRRKTEISSLQQQLDEAKKAGEETAAKLKEAMLGPPGRPLNKQFMMMVPMMMSSDGTGASQAVPMMNPGMMNPFMQQAAMPQAFCPMPPQAMAAPVAAAPLQAPAAQAHALAPTAAAAATAPGAKVAAPAMVAPAPAASAPQQLQPGQPAPTAAPAAFPYMMAPHMAGARGFMMPVPAPGHTMPGQPMAMMQQQMPSVGVPQGASQPDSNGHQEQKDSSPGLNGGSNLAHCA